MDNKSRPKQPRSAKNFLLFPDAQVKYALIYLLIFLVGFGILVFINHLLTAQILLLIEDPSLVAKIEQLQRGNSTLQLIILFASCLVIVPVTLVITHRFVGPIIPIIRYFKELEQKKPGARIHLRKEDALFPLAEYLETLEIQVEKKSTEVPSNNKKGMTVLEVLVTLFILSVVLVGFAGSMSMFNSDLQKVKVQATRTDITTLIRTNVKDFASLYNSSMMPENTELFSCMNGVSSTACSNYTEKQFTYYSAMKTIPVLDPNTGLGMLDAAGNPIYNPEQVAGVDSITCPTVNTSQSPVFYTKDGVRCKCTDQPVNCPIQAIAKYVAYCPNATATCAKAEGFKIVFQLKNRPDLPVNSNTNSVRFTDESGQFFVSLEQDDTYYMKFSFASSYFVDPITSTKTITANVSEFDIKQGKVLTFLKPAAINIDFSFSATENISYVNLLRYVYPSGCTLSNLGGTVTVAGVSVNCTPPTASQYTLVQKVAFTPVKVLLGSAADSVTSDSVVDYKLMGYNAANTLVIESQNNLRAFYNNSASLSVVPAPTVTFPCSNTSTANTFVFNAKSFNGWKSLKATLNPPGSFGGVSYPELPEFAANFDKTLTTDQNIVIDPKYYTPGATYTITFEGITTDDISRIDSKTFVIGAKPAESVTMSAPLPGSTIRTLADLPITANVNLACGKTIKSFDVLTRKSSNKSAIATISGLASNCVATSGAADENKFTCTTTVPCTSWLNAADTVACQAKFSSDTSVDAVGTITDNTNATTSGTSTFTAGSKISVQIAYNFVQWVLFSSASTPNSAATTPIQILFSSALLAGEAVELTMTPTGSPTAIQKFTCSISGSVNATYDSTNSRCTLNLVPPANADVFTLGTTNPAGVLVVAPLTVTFKQVTSSTLACTAQVGHPTCTAGQTLNQKMTVLGNFNYTYGDGNFTSATTYSIANAASAVDFFMYYQPKKTAAATLSVVLTASLPSGTPGIYDTYISRAGPTSTVGCTASQAQCPGDFAQVPASTFEARKTIFATNPFTIAYSNQNASGVAAKDALLEMMVVRECYCQ